MDSELYNKIKKGIALGVNGVLELNDNQVIFFFNNSGCISLNRDDEDKSLVPHVINNTWYIGNLNTYFQYNKNFKSSDSDNKEDINNSSSSNIDNDKINEFINNAVSKFMSDNIDKLKGDKGNPGKDGNPGEPGEKGDPGEKGEPGTNGKSAYEQALEGGYEGSEDDFKSLLANPMTDDKIHNTISDYVDKKICFDNIESLRVCDTLIENDIVATKGYYSNDDGGSATYKITNITEESLIKDCYIRINDSSLYAVPVFGATAKAEQIGLKRYNKNYNLSQSNLQSYINTIASFNTKRLNSFLSMYPMESITIDFGLGAYFFNDTIDCSKGTYQAHVTFKGDSYNISGSMLIYSFENDKWSNQGLFSGLFYVPNAESGKTFIKLTSGGLNLIGLSISSNSYVSRTLSYKDTALNNTEDPISYYESKTLIDGINGVEYLNTGNTQSIVKDCVFRGFSGYAVKPNQASKINNVRIFNCNVGIEHYATDVQIADCYITLCSKAINCSNTFAILFIYNNWIDQCEYGIYAPTASIGGNIEGLFDHLDGAAIYAGYIASLRLDARIGRCSCKYAHTSIDDFVLKEGYDNSNNTKFAESWKDYAFISAKSITKSQLSINSYKRDISDSNNTNYVLPKVLIAAYLANDNNINVIDVSNYTLFAPISNESSNDNLYSQNFVIEPTQTKNLLQMKPKVMPLHTALVDMITDKTIDKAIGVLTFDGWDVNTMTAIAPYLYEKGIPFTAFVGFNDNDISNMTSERLAAFHNIIDNYDADVQLYTSQPVNTFEGEANYQEQYLQFKQAYENFMAFGFDKPRFCAYSGGRHSAITPSILQKFGIKAARTTNNSIKVNSETDFDYPSLYLGNTNYTNFEKNINSLAQYKRPVFAMTHCILSDTVTDESFNLSEENMKAMIDTLASMQEAGKITFMNFSQFWDYIHFPHNPALNDEVLIWEGDNKQHKYMYTQSGWRELTA